MSEAVVRLVLTFLFVLLYSKGGAGDTNYPPRFQPVYPTTIKENAPNGTMIVHLNATDPNHKDTVTITSNDENTKRLVKIIIKDCTIKTGRCTVDITKANVFDRDTGSDTINLYFIASDGNLEVPLTYTVFLEDVNDNPPIFVKPFYQLSIKENSPDGTKFNQAGVLARDIDTGNNAVFTYMLEATGQSKLQFKDAFYINPQTGVIIQNTSLNYETLNYYQYNIIATDTGKTPLSSNAELTIKIVDVQDTPPYFQGLPYMRQLSEYSVKGTNVVTVSAIDGDRGIPRTVLYHLENSTCPSYFGLNNETGEITTTKELNRDEGVIEERHGTCQLLIKAYEVIKTGEPNVTSTSTTPVTITILDENDEMPIFNKSDYYVIISENTTGMHVPFTMINVTGIDVKDKDQTILYNEFTLNVHDASGIKVNITPIPRSVIGSAKVSLRNEILFDYESKKTQIYKLVAVDNNNSSLNSSCTIHVDILNVNEFYPEFDNDSYIAYIPEGSKQNTIVINVTAKDYDAEEYGQVTYSLRGAQGLFDINKKTGEVYVLTNQSEKLDRETRDSYFPTIEAVDGGNLRKIASLTIRLLDVNDNDPQFKLPTYSASVKENTKTFINGQLFVQANDADQKGNNNSIVSYELQEPYYLHNNFTINETSGEVYISHKVDYEDIPANESDSINLIVIATDHGSRSRSSNSSILVQIQDENDNSPHFVESTYHFNISEDAKAGTFVGIVAATDADRTAPNNDISFIIDSGALEMFYINANDGNMTKREGKKFDRENVGQYNITVLAVDKGTPTLRGSTTVIVTINDVNDEPPTFVQNIFHGQIYEKSNGISVANCTATDEDLDFNLYYQIVGISATDNNGNNVNNSLVENYFIINNETGEVTVNSEPDRETAVTVSLTLNVTDLNGKCKTPQFDIATLRITIKDVNDNAPEFESSVYPVNVSEGVSIGWNVITVTATDQDENQIIQYSLADNPEDSFEVDDKTGRIQITKKLDRERNGTLHINVSASDGLNTGYGEVIVTVLDINDNHPQFLQHLKSFSINEGNYSSVHHLIAVINATDADQGRNGDVTYSLSNNTHFEINQTTGAIYAINDIDRDKGTEQYTLTITASDNPSDKKLALKNTTSLTIHILDINDSPPTFSKNFSTNIPENTKNQTHVLTVTATDPDKGLNGTAGIHYYPGEDANGTHLFLVDEDGHIFVNADLRDMIGLFQFNVLVQDGGNPPQNTSTAVMIEVTDVNNNAPKFDYSTTAFGIYECAEKGAFVGNITATDKDFGENGRISYKLLHENGISPGPFCIDESTGNLSLCNDTLDASIKQKYQIIVLAKDHGDPVLDQRSDIFTIVVHDINDHPPEFNGNYTFNVSENVGNVKIGQVRAYDKDPVSNISYKILKGTYDYDTNFTIGDIDGIITLLTPLDRETIVNHQVQLKVQALDSTDPGDISKFCDHENHYTNVSITIVNITINDVDDEPPVFTNKSFSIGLRQQKEGGKKQKIFDFSLPKIVTDKDSPKYNHHFKLKSPALFSPGLKQRIQDAKPGACEQSGKTDHTDPPAFCLWHNGTMQTNMLFDTGMSGNITMQLIVSDKGGNDTAKFTVYLIADSQVVQMLLTRTKEDVSRNSKAILQVYDELRPGYRFVEDGIIEAEDHSPTVPRTRLLFHVVELGTNRILDAQEAVTLLDGISFNVVYEKLKGYGYSGVERFNAVKVEAEDDKEKEVFILIAVVVLEAVMLCIVVYFFCSSKSKFQRKLKAATVVSGGSSEDKSHKDSAPPGSNVYAAMKNPLLNKELPEPRQLDDISINSKNSLDANEVGVEGIVPVYDRMEEKEAVMEMYGDDFYQPETDALKMVLQDYAKLKEQEEDVSENAHINPVFAFEITEV